MVVTAGFAGTVIVAVPVLVASDTEVAVTVTVTAVLEAAGAVKVAPLVVVFERVPPPLTLHETPAAFLSFVTVALSVIAFVASTVVADAVTATLTVAGALVPPQPDRRKAAINEKQTRIELFRNIRFLTV